MSQYNTRSRKPSSQGISKLEDSLKIDTGVQKQSNNQQTPTPQTMQYNNGQEGRPSNTGNKNKTSGYQEQRYPQYPSSRGEQHFQNTQDLDSDIQNKKDKTTSLKKDLIEQLRQDNINFKQPQRKLSSEGIQNDSALSLSRNQDKIQTQPIAPTYVPQSEINRYPKINQQNTQQDTQALNTESGKSAQAQTFPIINQSSNKQQAQTNVKHNLKQDASNLQQQNFQMTWFQEQFQKLSYEQIMQLVSSNQDLSQIISNLGQSQNQQQSDILERRQSQKSPSKANSRQVSFDASTFSQTQDVNQSQIYESPTKQLLGYTSNDVINNKMAYQQSPKYSTTPTGNKLSGGVFRTQKYNAQENQGQGTEQQYQQGAQQQNVTVTNVPRISQQEEFFMSLWTKKWSNNPIQWAFSAIQIIYSFIPTIQQIWAQDSLEQAIQMQTQNRLLGLTKQVKSVLLWEDVQLTTKIFVVGFYLTLFIWQILQGSRLIRPFTTIAIVLFVALIANFIFVVRLKADNLRQNNFSRQIKEAVRSRNTALIVKVQKFTIHLFSKLASYIIPVTVALVTLFVKELYSGSLTPTLAFGSYLWLLACISETRILSQTSLIVFLYVSAFTLPCGYARFKSRLDKIANKMVKISVDYLDPKYRAAHISALIVGLVAMTGLGIHGLVLKTTVGFAAGVMFLFWRICVINKDITGHESKEQLLETKSSSRLTLDDVTKQPKVVKGNIGPRNKIEITEINNQNPISSIKI